MILLLMNRAERGKWRLIVISLFNDDGARANLSFYFAALTLSVFATRPQGEELRLFTLIVMMMVPFDSSRQQLSNGCHIVILVKFDILVETAAAALICRPSATF